MTALLYNIQGSFTIVASQQAVFSLLVTMIILFITIYCIDFRISINKCSMLCNHAKNISIYRKQ